MIISGFQKLTLLDYPEKTACLIFTQGCNFRCPFCHNKDLLCHSKGEFQEEEIFNYLEKRKGLIDGVCITGGEPLLQPDIQNFISKIKDMGFLVKLDTNGSNPEKLQELLNLNLLDYVAMDIKNDFNDYLETSGILKFNLDNIKKSIEIIKNSGIDYEFRTTIVKQLHNLDKILSICDYLGCDTKYYLQNYNDCETVLKKGLTGFDNEELINFKNILSKTYPNVIIRGI